MILEILTILVTVGLILALYTRAINPIQGIAIWIALGAILWGLKNTIMWDENPYGWFGVLKGITGVGFGIVLLYVKFKR